MDEKEPMTPSNLCEAWIKHREGCDLTAYPDNGAFSIGYGHRGVPEGTVWTQEQCDAAFDVDVAKLEPAVSALYPFTQSQFDAVVDFAYNLGLRRLQEMLSHGISQVPVQILRWCHEEKDGQEVVSEGLLTRRQEELDMWEGK